MGTVARKHGEGDGDESCQFLNAIPFDGRREQLSLTREQVGLNSGESEGVDDGRSEKREGVWKGEGKRRKKTRSASFLFLL